MNKTILMSILALTISVAFVSTGLAQQAPAGTQKPAAAQTPAAAVQKPAPAQAGAAKENWEKVRGVIESVNEASKEITVQAQKEKMAFSVGEKTRISEMTTKLSFSDLKKGMPVTIEYKKEGNKLLAEWVDVHAAKTEAKPAAQAKTMEVKKENPPGTSTPAPQTQAKEVKKENPSANTTEKK